MAISILTDKAIEESTFVVTAAFTDEDGGAVTPNSATWTLTDLEGNVINEREDVSISPDTSVYIVLSGDDLAMQGDGPSEDRLLLVKALYDSAKGSNLSLNGAVQFTIVGLTSVP